MKYQFSKHAALIATCVGTALTTPSFASAREGDLSSMFPVNDIDPKASIPTEEQREENPVEFGYWLQDMILRAEEGLENNDLEAAVKYYEALGWALPHNPTSFRKLCGAYRQMGKLEKAEASCWAVLQREGIRVYDHYHYLDVALPLVSASTPGVKERRTQMIESSLTRLRDLAVKNAEVKQAREYERRNKAADQQFEKVDAVEKRQAEKTELPLDIKIEMYQCQLGVSWGEAGRLQTCVENLRRVKAEPKVIAMFEWAWKTAAKDLEGQKAALEQAKKLGLPEAALSAMLNPTSVKVEAKPAVSTLPSDMNLEPPERKLVPDEPAAAVMTDQPPPTSKLESIVAAVAAALGLGAGGWLLFRQSGAKAGSNRRQTPVAKQS